MAKQVSARSKTDCKEGPSWTTCCLEVSFVDSIEDETVPSESPPGGAGKKLPSCRKQCLELRGDKGKETPCSEGRRHGGLEASPSTFEGQL